MQKIAKSILIVFVTIFIILTNLIFITNISYGTAAMSETKYLSLYHGTGQESKNGRPTGFYTSGQKNSGGAPGTIPIIKIVEVNSAEISATQKYGTDDEVIYCLNNGVGFGQEDGQSQAQDGLQYTNYYDMRNPVDIRTNFSEDSTFHTNGLESNNEYNELMWLLDNICKPEDADSVNKLFEEAGLEETKESLEKKLEPNCEPNETDKVFKDIIECIQQTAIWEITGTKIPADSLNINVSETNGVNNSTSIEQKYFKDDIAHDPLRTLYSYLTSKPKENSEYNYEQAKPDFSFDHDQANVKYLESEVKIGPYQITASNYSNFTVKITNGSSDVTDVKIVDESGSEFVGDDVTAKIQDSITKKQKFYLQLKPGTTGNIKIEVSADLNEKNIELWTTDVSSVKKSQPVVIIEENTTKESDYDSEEVKEQKTKVTVTKNWSDKGNQDGKQTAIKVKLTDKNDSNFSAQETTLSSSNQWSHTFDNLPVYSSEGKKRDYQVEEVDVPDGYTSSITSSTDEQGTNFTITNTLEPEKINIEVKKEWIGGSASTRPQSIEVKLYADGEDTDKKVTLTEENNWKDSFKDLDKYKPVKEEIKYTVKEEAQVPNYTSSEPVPTEKGFKITNTYNPGETEISVKKVWEDSNDQDGLRPHSITVELYNLSKPR